MYSFLISWEWPWFGILWSLRWPWWHRGGKLFEGPFTHLHSGPARVQRGQYGRGDPKGFPAGQLKNQVLHLIFKLIHASGPLSQPRQWSLFLHMLSFRTSLRPHLSKQNNVRYWRDCGSGHVDYWWHLSCLPLFLVENLINEYRKNARKCKCVSSS